MRILILLFFISLSLFANKCDNRLFTLNTKSGESVTIKDIVKSLSDSCHLSVDFKDNLVEKKLDKKLGYLKLNSVTFHKFLDYIFSKNNIFYTLNDNDLSLSFIKTKTFNVDYVTSQIAGTTNFAASMTPDDAATGNTLNSTFAFDFWTDFSKNLIDILNVNINRDLFSAPLPIIDKNSGLVTVTATKNQLDRVKKYIDDINQRTHKEVVIDVRIYTVSLSKSHSTGVDWSNLSLSLDEGVDKKSMSTGMQLSNIVGANSIFSATKFNVKGLLNFLSKSGTVNSVSNPKITTLNNQKAIINIGKIKNYTFQEVTTDKNGNKLSAEKVGSKFIGILLDITPQISDNNVIMMRINPSVTDLDSTGTESKVPNTIEKKLNTIVRIKDGDTLVLGGLITDTKITNSGGVPILKEIPIIKYAFSYKEEITERQELIFVITPHIIDFHKKKKIKDLGYQLPSLGDIK